MSDGNLDASAELDLRAFRLQLRPRKSLRQVARGAQLNESLLSRMETGSRVISGTYARRLARYYSRVTGTRITAGEIFNMGERATERRAGNEISFPGR